MRTRHRRSWSPRAVPTVAVGVLVLGFGLVSAVGVAPGATPAGSPALGRPVPAEAATTAPLATAFSRQFRPSRMLTNHTVDERANAFGPVSQPSVVLLVGGGVLTLVLLALVRIKNGIVGATTENQESKPWKSTTDADRVEKLLAANNGYMKQSAIVEETDWSKAKVSRLLTRMDEHGRIRKDKDGRENVIVLVGQ